MERIVQEDIYEDDIAVQPRADITAYGEEDTYHRGKDGFEVALQWWKESLFAFGCAVAFGAILHFFPENIFVFTNASLFVLFILLLVLISRLFRIGGLLSGILKAVPSVKRLK